MASPRPLLPKLRHHHLIFTAQPATAQQPPTPTRDPMAQVSTQQPHKHYIYKYVAGGSGGVLSGNNIRPFKYMGGR